MICLFTVWLMIATSLAPTEDTPPAKEPGTATEQPATTEPAAAKPDEGPTKITSSKLPYSEGENKHYQGNKAPLKPSALVKLHPGDVMARDWLDVQIRLLLRANDNFYFNLPKLSEHLNDDSGWKDSEKKGGEEAPLWLRGYGDIAYISKDVEATDTVKKWLDRIIESQEPEGYFGPKQNKADKNYWPNMIAVQALQARFEATKDDRILPFLTKYFKFRQSLDELYPHKVGDFDQHDKWVQNVRATDELESVFWLYNRTGEEWLLKLADRIREKSADWSKEIVSNQGTDIAYGLRAPAVQFIQTGETKLLDAVAKNYRGIYDEYGQAPGGMFAAAERIHKDRTGPEQAAEGCTIVEMMRTNETLLAITGDPIWADRCEEIAFNTYPSFLAPDNRAVRRMTAPNMVQCDKGDKHPKYDVKGMSVAFDPKEYDCCSHNAGAGWAQWTQSLWFATPGNGLAAVMYAPCLVRAKVASGVEVSIEEVTEYPFGDEVEFKISTPEPVSFPLSLRIPEWCENGRVSLNGNLKLLKPEPKAYVIIERKWNYGDTVKLHLPMNIRKKTWKEQGDAVSIYRGPLAYSLSIYEEWLRSGDKNWPTYEVKANKPWNYGLYFDTNDLEAALTYTPRTGVKVGQLFYTNSAPHSLKAKGYVLPDWKLDNLGFPEKLPKSPVKIQAVSPEDIELIPMGCARLRVSVFPTSQPES